MKKRNHGFLIHSFQGPIQEYLMTKVFGVRLVGLALLLLTGCGDGGKTGGKFPTLAPEEVTKTFEKSDAKIQTMDSGLKYQEIKEGTGAEAEAGKHIYVHYTGYLTDGTKFDSSLSHGKPFDFVLGTKRVIKGWDLGIVGMKAGGKRKLLIPSSLAYGSSGSGSAIPPDSDLVFEVELLKVD
jgi:FKBP-type peptidyl-prolyl cis-trans isomerase FkpA